MVEPALRSAVAVAAGVAEHFPISQEGVEAHRMEAAEGGRTAGREEAERGETGETPVGVAVAVRPPRGAQAGLEEEEGEEGRPRILMAEMAALAAAAVPECKAGERADSEEEEEENSLPEEQEDQEASAAEMPIAEEEAEPGSAARCSSWKGRP